MTLSETAVIDGPGAQIHPGSQTDAGAAPSARQIGNRPQDDVAGQGIAQTTLAPQRRSGDPDPSDRTNVVANPAQVLSGPDGGHRTADDRSYCAAVAPSGSAIDRPSSDDTLQTPRGGQEGADLSDKDHAAAHPSDPAKLETQSILPVRDQRGGQLHVVSRDDAAAAHPSGPAIENTSPETSVRDRGDGPLHNASRNGSAVANPSGPADDQVLSEKVTPGLGDGPWTQETRATTAVATPSAPAVQSSATKQTMPGQGDGPGLNDAHSSSAVATLVDLWRQRVDLRRAEGRLHLQALAVCRRALGGDKEAAQKLWKAIQKGTSDRTDVALVVEPYRIAAATLDGSAAALEKELAKRVRKLPLWTNWAADVRGMGELSLAGLIGEAAGSPGMYRSVSALWKRFGLAVFDGERQRRHSDPRMALLHGYAPQRRAFAYVVSANLMKSQKAEDPYRQIYDARKAYELARDIPKAHAHNRALRVMVKQLLKDAWLADRRARSGGAA